jgi:plasmid maintenance system antidote protein VapI
MSSTRLSPLNFEDLAHRLVRDIAGLIHSGVTTERRLAGLVGISQPHLHNVLNGARTLTTTIADRVMERLDWSLLDLVETQEAMALVDRREASLAQGREIPFGHLGVGNGFRFPGKTEGRVIAIPNLWLARTAKAFAVSSGEDSEMEYVIEDGDILLVDRASEVQTPIHEDALYVVATSVGSLARWVRFSPRGLYLLSAATFAEPTRWPLIVLPASRRFEIIQAKIIALARPPGRKFQRPLRPSASN